MGQEFERFVEDPRVLAVIREFIIMQDELMRYREFLVAAGGNHFCYFRHFCRTRFAAGGNKEILTFSNS